MHIYTYVHIFFYIEICNHFKLAEKYIKIFDCYEKCFLYYIYIIK